MNLSGWLLARVRTVATLVVLGLLLVWGATWGFSSVTQPFPKDADTPVCVSTALTNGDVLRPGAITISVLNAGTRNGLASLTRDGLVERGFAQGVLDNAPPDTTVRTAEIWTNDPDNPAVALVRSYLGGRVKVVERPPTVPGINVVVGDRFPGVRRGDRDIAILTDTRVCSPPILSGTATRSSVRQSPSH
ncbi:MAG: LytR C-terminal domain-containing protein [Nocardioides sp.]